MLEINLITYSRWNNQYVSYLRGRVQWHAIYKLQLLVKQQRCCNTKIKFGKLEPLRLGDLPFEVRIRRQLCDFVEVSVSCSIRPRKTPLSLHRSRSYYRALWTETKIGSTFDVRWREIRSSRSCVWPVFLSERNRFFILSRDKIDNRQGKSNQVAVGMYSANL